MSKTVYALGYISRNDFDNVYVNPRLDLALKVASQYGVGGIQIVLYKSRKKAYRDAHRANRQYNTLLWFVVPLTLV